jgi:hypothetical protein
VRSSIGRLAVRGIVVLAFAALSVVIQSVIEHYLPPGTDRNCNLNDCTTAHILSLAPLVLLLLLLGAALADRGSISTTSLLIGSFVTLRRPLQRYLSA